MVEPRLEAKKDLRQIPLLDEEHSTCVGTTIAAAEAELVHQALKRNVDLFVRTTSDMPGVSPTIFTHKLSIYKEARLVAQRKSKLGKIRGWQRRKRPRSYCRSGSYKRLGTPLG